MQEIANRGVPLKKIVVGKPATPGDATNTGYVNPSDLGGFFAQYKNSKNWQPSVMFWQLKNDPQGTICKTVLSRAGVDYKKTGYMDGSNNTTPG